MSRTFDQYAGNDIPFPRKGWRLDYLIFFVNVNEGLVNLLGQWLEVAILMIVSNTTTTSSKHETAT